MGVQTGNEVTLDFMDADEVTSQHYAFLISRTSPLDAIQNPGKTDLRRLDPALRRDDDIRPAT